MASSSCYCGNKLDFEQCCKTFIEKQRVPKTAEQLMRSRYSAYVIKDYPYILATYAAEQRVELSTEALAQSAGETQWLKLEVQEASTTANTARVRFKAFYRDQGQFYLMHEDSSFILEDNQWRYTQGQMQPDSGLLKPGRNDECLCGSQKKFKKCCGR